MIWQMPWTAMIMPDELTYSRDAYFGAWYEPSVGQYLFSLVFGVTGIFGSGFYFAAKFLNIILWTISAFVVVDISRRMVSPSTSLALGILFLILPASFYTSSFMPEAQLALFVLLSIATLIRATENPGLVNFFLFAGFAYLASMTKSHGSLFLLVAVVACLVLALVHKSTLWLRLAALSGAVVVLRGLSGVLLGESFPFLFGSYSRAFSNTQTSVTEGGLAIGFLNQLPSSLFLHLCFVGLLIPFLLIVIPMRHRKDLAGASFVILVLWGMVSVAIIYHSLAISRGEGLGVQLLSRYFEFLIPIGIAAAAAKLDLDGKKAHFVMFAVLPILAFVGLMIQGAEFQSAANSISGSIILTRSNLVLAVVIVAVWAFVAGYFLFSREGFKEKLVLIPFAALTIGFASFSSYYAFQSDYDKAGADVSTIVSAMGEVPILVVGENPLNLRAVAFYGRSPNVDWAPSDVCIAENRCEYDFVVFLDDRKPKSDNLSILSFSETHTIYRTLAK